MERGTSGHKRSQRKRALFDLREKCTFVIKTYVCTYMHLMHLSFGMAVSKKKKKRKKQKREQ